MDASVYMECLLALRFQNAKNSLKNMSYSWNLPFPPNPQILAQILQKWENKAIIGIELCMLEFKVANGS